MSMIKDPPMVHNLRDGFIDFICVVSAHSAYEIRNGTRAMGSPIAICVIAGWERPFRMTSLR